MNNSFSPIPENLNSYASNREYKLQIFIIHSLVVAGKTAVFANNAIKNFIGDYTGKPFDLIKQLIKDNTLIDRIKKAKLGNYSKMDKAFREIINLDLEKCTVDDLEKIHGIGPKTARYFLMYTRNNIDTKDLIPIDTHVLKRCNDEPFIKERLDNLGIKIPKSSPSGKKYKIIEKIIVEHAKQLGISTRQWDSDTWDYYSKYTDTAREIAKSSLEKGN